MFLGFVGVALRLAKSEEIMFSSSGNRSVPLCSQAHDKKMSLTSLV